jgi:nucleoside-diphosphate-sugar epimerase
MRALLVGGSGATGILIAQGLAERGYDLTILHRGSHEPSELEPFRHIHADPHFAEPVADALGSERFDVVVLTYGRLKLLAPLFSGRCERLLAIGGMPIYPGYLDPGAESPRGMPIPSREEDPLVDPARMTSPGAARFAAKMLEAENAVMDQHRAGGYAASIFRYPAIYGRRAMGLTDWSIVRRALDGRSFLLLPDAGKGIIARCAAENAAWCVLAALDCEAAKGEAFNCADAEQYTLAQWAELILDVLGKMMEFVPIPPQLNWAAAHLLPLGGTCSDHGVLDISKSRRILGYRDQVRAKDALARAIRWRLANPPTPGELANWQDPLAYDLEDRIKAEIDGLVARLEPLKQEPEVVHPYPHPKEPGLTVDHRGR